MPGWSPSARLRAAAGNPSGLRPPHILASPPGVPAPINAINYTPSTGEIHHRGVMAPIDALNYSLIPSDVGAGGGFSEGAAATGSMGAGQSHGVPPVMPTVPGQENMFGRYSPPASMASGQTAPGAPPMRPSPYLTGPGIRPSPTGPAVPSFDRRSSMWGARSGMGVGQDAGETSRFQDPPDLQLPSPDTTATDTAPAADTTPAPSAAPAVSPAPSASAAPTSIVGQVSSATAATADNPPQGWHTEGAPDDNPRKPSQVWWVSDDGKTHILVGFILYSPQPGTPPTFSRADAAVRAYSSYTDGDPTHKIPELQTTARAPTTKVLTVDPRTGQPFPDGLAHTMAYDPTTKDFTDDKGPAPSQTGATSHITTIDTTGRYGYGRGVAVDLQYNPSTHAFDKPIGPSATQPKTSPLSPASGTTAGGTAGGPQFVGTSDVYIPAGSSLELGAQRQRVIGAPAPPPPPSPAPAPSTAASEGNCPPGMRPSTSATAGVSPPTPPSEQESLSRVGGWAGDAYAQQQGAQAPPGPQPIPNVVPGGPEDNPPLVPLPNATPGEGDLTQATPAGAGADVFMGRGLSPPVGRGSTGMGYFHPGWGPQGRGWRPGAGHGNVGGSSSRGGMGGSGIGGGGGVGQDAGTPVAPPPPEGAAPQPGGAAAPSQLPGWTPPLPQQAVAGIGHRFGQPMNVGEPQHTGVDLQAPEGTGTVSPVDGMVERVENNPQGLGLTVVIRGKDGTEHRLGHLSRTQAYPGMRVAQGQDLQSKVGSSGNATGSHLHWGVRDQQGQPVDNTAALGPMANMPPVPGTEMMGPPGGTPGPTGPTPGGAGQDVGATLKRAGEAIQRRPYPTPGPGGLGVWDPRFGPEGEASRLWQGVKKGVQGINTAIHGGLHAPSLTRAPDVQRPWATPTPGAGQDGWAPRSPIAQNPMTSPYGSGQDTSSQDYQAGYQAGLQASKSPGTPPVFVPAMQQPIPSASDQQDMGAGAGEENLPTYNYLGGLDSGLGRDDPIYTSGPPESGYSGGWTGSMTGRPFEGGTRGYDVKIDLSNPPGAGQATGTTYSTSQSDVGPDGKYRTLWGNLTLEEIMADARAAGWTEADGDPVAWYNELANAYHSGGTPDLSGGAAADVPTGGTDVIQTGEQARLLQAIQTQQLQAADAELRALADQGNRVLTAQGLAHYNAWYAQNQDRLQLLRDILGNSYAQMLTGMAPQPGEPIGQAPAMRQLAQDLLTPYQFPSWYTPGQTDPTGGTFYPTPGNYLPVPGQPGTSGGVQIDAYGNLTPAGSTTPGALTEPGAATTEAAAAGDTGGKYHGTLQPAGGAATSSGPFTQPEPDLATWNSWTPWQRNSYIANVQANQLYGGPTWSQTQGDLMRSWGGPSAANVTEMQAGAASPEEQVGQAMTANVMGQTTPQWGARQAGQWSRAQAPRVKQQFSGIAA